MLEILSGAFGWVEEGIWTIIKFLFGTWPGWIILFIIWFISAFFGDSSDSYSASSGRTYGNSCSNSQYREPYVDASGKYRMQGEPFVDESGKYRMQGEPFVDASGKYRMPGEPFVDGAGKYRLPGEPYVDGSGTYRY